ncbi:hypothetical protein BCR35DRAFT_40665 [Leucosporidium creatinivorum]|uniref:F-box domain-containing protein n=1 Tax=Leucosporidium creatinivorum TaxID=106004 RepID=A0A1Y2C7W6_9BASI|nr:hypothetical protein BCR35DRAFT_40665 [Leucosporidium creatinivorum]
MDASLTGDLEKLTLQQSSSEGELLALFCSRDERELTLVSSVAAPSSQPVVPAEIIQHILSFLNPSDALTLPTLLACQLVSRYFAASSLDASVWRPLVEARWKHEAFEKPMKQLPLEEDQKLIDELFPTAESNLAATFRARFLLDSLVQRHIKKLVLGVKDRLISIDTIVALGKQVWDALYREEEIDGADESIHYSNVGWRKTTLNVSRRAEATKLWMRIASGELAGDEAVELGIFALNDFSPSGFPGQLEKLFCKCVESCTRVLAIGSDIKELRYRDPSTALESVTRLIWAQIDKLGMSNTRIELEAFGEGKNIDSTALDHVSSLLGRFEARRRSFSLFLLHSAFSMLPFAAPLTFVQRGPPTRPQTSSTSVSSSTKPSSSSSLGACLRPSPLGSSSPALIMSDRLSGSKILGLLVLSAWPLGASPLQCSKPAFVTTPRISRATRRSLCSPRSLPMSRKQPKRMLGLVKSCRFKQEDTPTCFSSPASIHSTTAFSFLSSQNISSASTASPRTPSTSASSSTCSSLTSPRAS